MNDLHTFPKTHMQALAMLYMQNQNLSGKTPTEIHNMYWDAYYEIEKDQNAKCQNGYHAGKRRESR